MNSKKLNFINKNNNNNNYNYYYLSKMFDLLYYFMVVMFIIYILKSVKKHNKIKLKNVIKPNITTPLYKNENLYKICINNITQYIDNHVNKSINELQNIEYNRPLYNQL